MDEEMFDSDEDREVVILKEKSEKAQPSAKPKAQPSAKPKAQPSAKPKAQSSAKPKAQSSAKPKAQPLAKPKEKAADLTKPIKKSILDLVCEAIEATGDKKGVSVPIIKQYVKSHRDPLPTNIDVLIKNALNKGIETGKLERPPSSKDLKGAVGRFRLPKKSDSKHTNIKTEKRQTPEEYVSDSEAAEKPVKQRKRTLSDTYIEEIKATSTPKPFLKRTIDLKEVKRIKKIPLAKKVNEKKDTSDTKLGAKEAKRKSYSSDTEADFKSQNTKAAKENPKKTKSDKPKKEKADSTSNITKREVKKLYNEGGKDNAVKTKSEKTKAKKQ